MVICVCVLGNKIFAESGGVKSIAIRRLNLLSNSAEKSVILVHSHQKFCNPENIPVLERNLSHVYYDLEAY